MRQDTKKRKNASQVLKNLDEDNWLGNKLGDVISEGKQALDALALELGRTVAESLMYMEREELTGPEYQPHQSGVYKWASQQGSVYLGSQKVKLQRPRARASDGEIPLKSYQQMRQREAFSEQLLGRALRGLSASRYEETLDDVAEHFGVSRSSTSRHIVEATTKQLKQFRERDLSAFEPFAVILDAIHRGDDAFIVAVGIDRDGQKQALGFWQGATENQDVCQDLLSDLEKRGMKLSSEIIWCTDGGKGLIKALKNRFGKKLIHVRCMVHKSRNLQRHLAKRYRNEAHEKLTRALQQNNYPDAKQMLDELEKWLVKINESAARSLREAKEELLTLHRLKVPENLRKTLRTTNTIESMFSNVRACEKNIKRYRNSKMTQRWLASVLLHCEKRFRRVRGYRSIPIVQKRIKLMQKKKTKKQAKQNLNKSKRKVA